MPSTEDLVTGNTLSNGAIQWLLAAILVTAPLFRAGQAPIALLALELLAVATLIIVLWTPRRIPGTRLEFFALILLFVFPLLYLAPLPEELLNLLPGREQYAAALSLLGDQAANDLARVSLHPLETESAWLLLLVPIAVFLGVRTLGTDAAFKLVLLTLGVATVQSTLGLMQFGDGKDSPLYLGMNTTHVGSAIGTYTNRNHLAGLLEMVLPVTLALMIFSIGRGHHGFARNWRGRISFLASVRGHSALVYGALTLLLLVAVIFTRSRSGIALTMLGILLVTFALSRRIGGNNVYGPTGTLVTVALGIGIVLGLTPVLNRFSAAEVLADNRLTIFSATFDGIGTFFPVGSGPGTYSDIFPAFQPREVGRWFINHAHNDYLEWLFEGGLFAALLILLMLLLYMRQWLRVWTSAEWMRFKYVQVGAGISVFLLLLHTLVDYNLHIPANIIFFAFFAAIFFSDPTQEEKSEHQRKRKRKRKRQTPVIVEQQGSFTAAPKSNPTAEATEQIKNPFLD